MAAVSVAGACRIFSCHIACQTAICIVLTSKLGLICKLHCMPCAEAQVGGAFGGCSTAAASPDQAAVARLVHLIT
jgi:hypothetical protein